MSTTTIHPDELQQKLDANEPMRLVDVRTPGEYGAEHLPESELMPLDQLDANAFGDNGDTPIYLLCRTGRRAGEAYEALAAAGVSNARVIEGGLEACKQQNLPVIKGRGTISLERQVRIGAGGLVLLGVLLGWLAHPGFYGLSAFVGAGLMFAGITDWCGMAMMLARMPWNRSGPTRQQCADAS